MTFGYSQDANSFLTGESYGVTGLPGAAFTNDGNYACVVGTPQVSDTYGISGESIASWFTGLGQTMADGFYHQAGEPYTAPEMVSQQ